MKPLPKVIGVIQARNAWPFLALSVSHALMYHVDEVYLLNHACTDESHEGAEYLRTLWKNRVHVFNFYDEVFWQEAATNALIQISQESSPDWIFVFDADEFLLTEKNTSLKTILSDLDEKYCAVSYEIQNWVSLRDFEEQNFSHYRKLRYRSVANNLYRHLHFELRSDEISNGNLNFYDLPFTSKVIFKNSASAWLGPGAHELKSHLEGQIFEIKSEKLRVAHFPFLTRQRLGVRIQQGERHIRGGAPPRRGWQSQMIYKLSRENKLDQFWERHSIALHNDLHEAGRPSVVVDDSFIKSIEPVLSFLEEGSGFQVDQKNFERNVLLSQGVDTQVPFRTLVHVARKFQLIADSFREERSVLCQERDMLFAQADSLKNGDNALKWTAILRLIFKKLSCYFRRVPLPGSVKKIMDSFCSVLRKK